MEAKRVLVIDDDAEILKMLEQKLRNNDYECLATTSTKDIMSLCKTFMPHLILLDIAMPEMDGYETCKMLRNDRNTRGIPVVFLTGKELDPKGIMERCQDLSVVGYVSKLSSLQELLDKVKEIIK